VEAAKKILAAPLPTMSFYLRTEDCERDRQQIIAAIIQKHAPSAQGEDSARLLELAQRAVDAVCIEEKYVGTDGRRSWANSASMWLYPDSAVAYISEVSAIEAFRAAMAARKETAMATKEVK
jgi:hypothetical protein